MGHFQICLVAMKTTGILGGSRSAQQVFFDMHFEMHFNESFCVTPESFPERGTTLNQMRN
jgi:hypothetical protein